MIPIFAIPLDGCRLIRPVLHVRPGGAILRGVIFRRTDATSGNHVGEGSKSQCTQKEVEDGE